MLINTKKKIIILQNPKTGGQFKANQVADGKGDFSRRHVMNYFRQDGSNHNVIFPFHITYDELREYLGDDFNNWTIYVVVRNPYDRVASAINFRRRNLAQQYNSEDYSFENALNLVEQHKEILEPTYENIWFTAQSFWCGENVNILKYESEEDWKFLDELLGIKGSMVHIRPSYELSGATKEKIKSIYYPLDKDIFEMYNL